MPSSQWGQVGTRQHRWLILSLLQLVPVCPQPVPAGRPRKPQPWRGVPVSPFVPIEIAQVSAGFSSSCLSVAPGYRYVVAGVYWSDKCFCPFRTPKRCGNYKGHGTPLPYCAEVFLLAAAARGIGTDGACCCKSVHRVEPLSQGPGVRQKTPWLTWPAGSGRVQIALHGLRF